MARRMRKRNVTEHDRRVDRENALMGVRKWRRTSTGARRAERVRTKHGWGFEGSSPNTRKRKYKKKKA